jgi:hypothetical protein
MVKIQFRQNWTNYTPNCNLNVWDVISNTDLPRYIRFIDCCLHVEQTTVHLSKLLGITMFLVAKLVRTLISKQKATMPIMEVTSTADTQTHWWRNILVSLNLREWDRSRRSSKEPDLPSIRLHKEVFFRLPVYQRGYLKERRSQLTLLTSNFNSLHLQWSSSVFTI